MHGETVKLYSLTSLVVEQTSFYIHFQDSKYG